MGDESLIVLDTHVLVWWLNAAPGFSTPAKRATKTHGGQIVASTISVLEIATAISSGRLQFTMPVAPWLADMRCIPDLRLEPVSVDIAALAGSLPEPMHGDPADRIIAATAIVLSAALVLATRGCGRIDRSRRSGNRQGCAAIRFRVSCRQRRRVHRAHHR